MAIMSFRGVDPGAVDYPNKSRESTTSHNKKEVIESMGKCMSAQKKRKLVQHAARSSFQQSESGRPIVLSNTVRAFSSPSLNREWKKRKNDRHVVTLQAQAVH